MSEILSTLEVSTDLRDEVKEKGWRQIIEECSDDAICADLSVFYDLAQEWHNCAVGQILGFPDSATAWKIVDRLPRELHHLGTDFAEDLYENNAENALDTLSQIEEHRDLILETAKDIKMGY